MSEQQWKMLDVVKRVEAQLLTSAMAAQIVGLSTRQFRRVRRRVASLGNKAVVHGNRGRTPGNKLGDAVRAHVIALRETKYAGFNDQHFTEKLLTEEELSLSRSTVQRLLRGAGIPAPQKRRARKHRRRRERKSQEGVMLLWDGSRHEWLEGRGPWLCLVGAIDDATGQVMPGAHFGLQETSVAYLTTLKAIVTSKGVPLSIYQDRHSALQRNDASWSIEEELRGKQDPTQVGRAMETLGIEAIYALSPQAKGRVERLWKTLQDRLCSELRLVGATTMEEANEVLRRYIPEFNKRFSIAACDAEAGWRALRVDADEACSFVYEATVGNDNAVRLEGEVIDIPPGPRGRSYAKVRVQVRQLLDASWRVYHHGVRIATKEGNQLTEVKPRARKKRSVASRAFRKAVVEVDLAVLERRRGRAQPSSCGQLADHLPTRTPRRLSKPPFNCFDEKRRVTPTPRGGQNR